MQVDISIGELFDKITILEIKQKKITDKSKLRNVEKELDILNPLSIPIKTFHGSKLIELIDQLAKVNKELWDVEDKLRILERDQRFDEEFIKLARSVYYQNDKRAVIKKDINLLTSSDIVEEKNYVNYDKF